MIRCCRHNSAGVNPRLALFPDSILGMAQPQTCALAQTPVPSGPRWDRVAIILRNTLTLIVLPPSFTIPETQHVRLGAFCTPVKCPGLLYQSQCKFSVDCEEKPAGAMIL